MNAGLNRLKYRDFESIVFFLVIWFFLIPFPFFPEIYAGGAELQYERVTDHYIIRTDVSRDFAELIAQHMESIYTEYRRRFPDYERQNTGKFYVKVFQRRRDYNNNVPAQVRGSVGVFISRERLIAAFTEGRSQERVFRTLYHEGFHQFLYEYVGPYVPLWINEGFAEYFAEANWNGRRFETGQKPWERLHIVQSAIQSGRHIPLERLFMVESDEWLANVRENNTRSNLQYSQSWSVIHFLVHARRGHFRGRLFGYLDSLLEGVSRAEAFKSNFGNDIDGMERAWKRYVMELEPDRLSKCRKNMELIMYLAAQFYDSPEEFTALKDFVHDFLKGDYQWSIQAGDGERITSDDTDRLLEMLRCGEDGNRNTPASYTLVQNPQNNMPELYCLHHRGVIIRASLHRDSGRWQPLSEVIVRETVSDELLRRLRNR